MDSGADADRNEVRKWCGKPYTPKKYGSIAKLQVEAHELKACMWACRLDIEKNNIGSRNAPWWADIEQRPEAGRVKRANKEAAAWARNALAGGDLEVEANTSIWWKKQEIAKSNGKKGEWEQRKGWNFFFARSDEFKAKLLGAATQPRTSVIGKARDVWDIATGNVCDARLPYSARRSARCAKGVGLLRAAGYVIFSKELETRQSQCAIVVRSDRAKKDVVRNIKKEHWNIEVELNSATRRC